MAYLTRASSSFDHRGSKNYPVSIFCLSINVFWFVYFLFVCFFVCLFFCLQLPIAKKSSTPPNVSLEKIAQLLNNIVDESKFIQHVLFVYGHK